jgi:hypothetical protein
MSSALSDDHFARISALVAEARRLLNLIDSFSHTTSSTDPNTSSSSSQLPNASSSSSSSVISPSTKPKIGGMNKFRKRVVAELEFLQVRPIITEGET